MGQTISVVSGKGGTGKTSFTANVGMALAQMGHPTLCLDCDVGLRNLDIAMVMTDRAVMDFTDVLAGRCTLEEAAAAHPKQKNLFLLTAPNRETWVDESLFQGLFEEINRKFDYCLVDAPAGLGIGFRLAISGADRAVVVTTAEASSLRDTQHTVMELNRFPAGMLHLVVNRVRRKMLRHMHATIDDAIDRAGLPLIGVIPEDDALPLSLNRGVPLLLASSQGAAAAYRNIARRLQGERVPLLRIK